MYEYFRISAEDLGKDAKIPLVKLGDSGEVFYEMALEMVNTIKEHNARGGEDRLHLPGRPRGPVSHLRPAGEPGSGVPEELLVLQHGRVPER